jgi:hypothetical protein
MQHYLKPLSLETNVYDILDDYKFQTKEFGRINFLAIIEKEEKEK